MPSAKEVNRALARIRAVMPAERKLASANRNIRLGLERIDRVVPKEQSWAGIHVGGTNGKGSICALLSGLFKLSGLSHGMYNSPAMPERHNGVTINGHYINKRMYDMEINHIEAKFKRISAGWTFSKGEDPGDLTPFEVETAAALRAFNKLHVKYGIVEVGMGGATDATNVMREKSITIISKIGLDHQEYLGDTIEEIAKVKAGIMRAGVPCIVDHTNPSSVIKVLREHANSIGTQISPTWKGLPLLSELDTDRFKLEDYERQNLLCAVLAFRHLFPHLDIDVNKLLATAPYQQGRKESVGVLKLTGGTRSEPVLVDGAHNLLGVEALNTHVEHRVREGDKPVTWVMGLSSSKSKPFAKLIETLVKPQDNFAFVEYIPGGNEPPPVPAELGRDLAKSIVKNEVQLYDGEPLVGPAIQWACNKAGSGPVIVTGSLYMLRNFYMLEGISSRRSLKTRRPGRGQLWHYIQLSQKRSLTAEESVQFKKARRHWFLAPDRNPTFRTVREDGKVASPIVPGQIRVLQRVVAFHKTQADNYAKAISSAEKDVQEDSERAIIMKTRDGTAELRLTIDEMKKRHESHLSKYSSNMFKLRGYVAVPGRKFMSYREIFGRDQERNQRQYPTGTERSTEANERSSSSVFNAKTDTLSTATVSGSKGKAQPSQSLDESSKFARKTPGVGIALRHILKREAQDEKQADVKERAVAEAQDLVEKLTSGRK